MSARDWAFAIFIGCVVAAVVAIGSRAMGLSVIWPGAIVGGVMATASMIMSLDR